MGKAVKFNEEEDYLVVADAHHLPLHGIFLLSEIAEYTNQSKYRRL